MPKSKTTKKKNTHIYIFNLSARARLLHQSERNEILPFRSGKKRNGKKQKTFYVTSFCHFVLEKKKKREDSGSGKVRSDDSGKEKQVPKLLPLSGFRSVLGPSRCPPLLLLRAAAAAAGCLLCVRSIANRDLEQKLHEGVPGTKSWYVNMLVDDHSSST